MRAVFGFALVCFSLILRPDVANGAVQVNGLTFSVSDLFERAEEDGGAGVGTHFHSGANHVVPPILSGDAEVGSFFGDEETPTQGVSCRTSVGVLIPIRRVLAQRTLTGVPIKVLSPQVFPYAVSLKPDKIDLSLSGTESDLELVGLAHVTAYVDVTGDTEPGILAPSVRFQLPKGISLANGFRTPEVTMELKLLPK